MRNKCVKLCVYLTRDVSKSDHDLIEDVRRASAILAQCGIEFRVKNRFTPEKLPALNVSFQNKEIKVCGSIPNTPENEKLKQLLAVREECNEDEVAVYYVGEGAFEGNSVSCFYFQEENDQKRFSVVLTSVASSDFLAHELGHALMVREHGKYDDPINPDPADKIHNIEPCNLMNKTVKGINLNERQCVIANKSSLLKEWSPPSEMFRKIHYRGSLFIRDDDSGLFDPRAADSETHTVKSHEVRIGPLNTNDSYFQAIFTTDEVQIYIHYNWTWNFDLSITFEIGMSLYEDDSLISGLIYDDLDGESSKVVTIPKDAVDVEVKLNVFNEDENDTHTFGSLKLFVSNEIGFSGEN
ncbi:MULTISPECIES: hypothetical protein [Bacillaceae]|uniref:hypothetical protein n=1 Tax=Bacillaceae TaxID=186817 RepID=UPI000BA67D4B|nr:MULTISPECIES: hypothetical protein [Bacillaceae]PAE23900.1 hypothetical protein CHI10_15770 [Bacillus sp. 7894-2]URM34774.1 hypothetical protein LLY41_10480 [Cytobacillus firmus]